MSFRTGLAIALLGLGLAACERSAEIAPAGNPASSVPASNVSQEAPDRVSEAAAPLLTAEGYGPLRIGMTLADVVTALGPDSDPDSVGGPDPEACDQFRPARAPEGVLVMIEEGRLTRISLISGTELKTDRNLGLGATAATVRAAYGDRLRAEPHKYSDPPAEYLTVWTRGGPGSDGIASPDSRGIRYEIGTDGRVETIHVGGDSIQYVEGCL
jgi:hypothetical protein